MNEMENNKYELSNQELYENGFIYTIEIGADYPSLYGVLLIGKLDKDKYVNEKSFTGLKRTKGLTEYNRVSMSLDQIKEFRDHLTKLINFEDKNNESQWKTDEMCRPVFDPKGISK
jgi:hypothetical protein